MIEVQNLTRCFGDCIAVDHADLKIRNGHIYGLLGPDGAGKSTLMNLIAGCLAPTEGTVRINGYDPERQPKEAKRQIGYLPEQPPLFPDMTPYEYLAFVGEAKGVRDEALDRQVKEALALSDLTGMENTLIRFLPNAAFARLGIAQTMLGKPDIILLDEPSAGLDPIHRAEITALIRRLGERSTVVVAASSPAEICGLCDRVILLSHGRVEADEEMGEWLSRLPSDEAAALVSESGLSANDPGSGVDLEIEAEVGSESEAEIETESEQDSDDRSFEEVTD